MAIVMILEDGLVCPVVICDHCEKRIENADDGNYQWLGWVAKLKEHATIYFTHKRCCESFEAAYKLPASIWMAMELKCFPIYLANNIKLNWEKAKKTVQVMDSFRV